MRLFRSAGLKKKGQESMNAINESAGKITSKTLLESLVRFSVVILMAYMCLRIASPFINILVWGLMLAIMLFPLHQKLARKLGGKQGTAAAMMILIFFLVILPPLVLLSGSLVDEASDFKSAYEAGEITVSAPSPGVKDLPLIGERVFDSWSEASRNLPEFLGNHGAQLETIGGAVIGAAGNAIGGVFLFIGRLRHRRHHDDLQ